jgi:hypothetical protein
VWGSGCIDPCTFDLTPSRNCIRGWVGPGTGMDNMKKRKSLAPIVPHIVPLAIQTIPNYYTNCLYAWDWRLHNGNLHNLYFSPCIIRVDKWSWDACNKEYKKAHSFKSPVKTWKENPSCRSCDVHTHTHTHTCRSTETPIHGSLRSNGF